MAGDRGPERHSAAQPRQRHDPRRSERLRPRSPVTVAYTAGYDTAPDDVVQACIELVGEAYRRREHIGQASVSMKDQSTVSFSQADMNASIKTMLASYRRLVPC
jgi:GTP cyclohydrolase III